MVRRLRSGRWTQVRFLHRDPVEKLEPAYRRVLEEARDLLRNDDVTGFAARAAQGEDPARQVEAWKAEGS